MMMYRTKAPYSMIDKDIIGVVVDGWWIRFETKSWSVTMAISICEKQKEIFELLSIDEQIEIKVKEIRTKEREIYELIKKKNGFW